MPFGEALRVFHNNKRTVIITDFFSNCGLQYGELPHGYGKRGYHKQYSYLDEPYAMTITMHTRETDDGMTIGY